MSDDIFHGCFVTVDNSLSAIFEEELNVWRSRFILRCRDYNVLIFETQLWDNILDEFEQTITSFILIISRSVVLDVNGCNLLDEKVTFSRFFENRVKI